MNENILLEKRPTSGNMHLRVQNKIIMFVGQHGDQNNQNDLGLAKKMSPKRKKINGILSASFSSQKK